ncbi:MAG: cell division protein FtsA [Nitrospiraceae bacterium]|nr:MAG: cell division protein FtsA [Nitrospiraceae bacterium]
MHFGFIKNVASKDSRIVAGLDVGSSKVCALVGEVPLSGRRGNEKANAGINIIGLGTSQSKGIKKGVVINIEQTVESIREAVEKAGEMASVDIRTVNIGVTGGHISCIPSHGVIAVKEKEIGMKEVDMAIEAAKAVAIPFDREILHVVPSEFIVNGQGGITDPRGMVGVRLEVKVNIITGAASSIQNLIKCCQKAGLEVTDVVFQPLAAADAVLTHDEKDLGVALVDIGGGTTDIAVFQEGQMSHFSVLAVGGGNFTNDVAIGLRLPFQEAEQLKKEYGCTMLSLINTGEEMKIGHAGGKTGKDMPRTHLVEILQPRAEELFKLIKEEITGKGYHRLINSGVVLTGGAVLMEGMDIMAENVLELPVRTGHPAGVTGIQDIGSPAYAAGIGLALREADAFAEEERANGESLIHGIKSKVSGWFRS